ncbi:MAG: glucose-6-phosphate dehydrogenase assembly protein OpcA, partial [Armatimonadota bacterium]
MREDQDPDSRNSDTAATWSVQADASLTALPRPAAIADVEAELARLWASAEAQYPEAVLTRAALANIVILCPDASAVKLARDVAGLLADSHPSRVFVILAEHRDAAPSLQAWVSARCFIQPDGSRQVCCEEIMITAAGSSREFLSHTVSSLFLPDLPAFLCLTTLRRSDLDRVRDFAVVCDKLIWDADVFDGPAEMIPEAARLRSQVPATSIGDLAWIRTAPLRQQVLAEITKSGFSSADIRSVRISCPPTGLGSALLIAGWLASALGWRPQSCRQDRRKLSFAMQNDRTAGPAVVEVSAGLEQDAGITITLSATVDITVTPEQPWQPPCGSDRTDDGRLSEVTSLLCLALESLTP